MVHVVCRGQSEEEDSFDDLAPGKKRPNTNQEGLPPGMDFDPDFGQEFGPDFSLEFGLDFDDPLTAFI